ncbi:hypothetical protein XarbCFBP8132_10770 [Xanthomonas arboricola]|nr:hypothetical protein XarbCFBP8132_10770 [Xanthomonas arboricola]
MRRGRSKARAPVARKPCFLAPQGEGCVQHRGQPHKVAQHFLVTFCRPLICVQIRMHRDQSFFLSQRPSIVMNHQHLCE